MTDATGGYCYNNSPSNPGISNMETDTRSYFRSHKETRPDTSERVSYNVQEEGTSINLDKTRQFLDLMDRAIKLKPMIERDINKLERVACSAFRQADGELERQLQSTVAENRKLREQNENLMMVLSNQNIVESMYIKVSKTDKENQDEQMKKLAEENNRLEEELRQTTKTIKEATGKIKELENRYRTVRMDLQDAVKVKEENQKLVQSMAEETDKMKQKLAKQDEELQKRSQGLKETMKELDETKSRLSQMMGSQMRDGNPYIADLSDKNRPTKLGEMYSELYDNEWTDAFDILQKVTVEQDEKGIVKQLYDILMDINTFCQSEAERQIETLKESLCFGYKTDIPIPESITRKIKELQLSSAESAVDIVFERYTRRRSRSSRVRSVPEFVKKCIYICWLMAIQDPPLVFKMDSEAKVSFSKDVYKAYTKYGSYIEFIVWPPLLLHEGGPLIAKGVAQGFIHEQKPDKGLQMQAKISRSPSEPVQAWGTPTSTVWYPSTETNMTYSQTVMQPFNNTEISTQNACSGSQRVHQSGSGSHLLREVLQSLNQNAAVSSSPQHTPSAYGRGTDLSAYQHNQFNTTYHVHRH